VITGGHKERPDANSAQPTRARESELQPASTAAARTPATQDREPAPAALFTGLLSPADKIVIAYIGLIAAVIAVLHKQVPGWPALLVGHALACSIVVVIALVSRSARISRLRPGALIRGWYPVALIPMTYKELGYLIPLVHPHDLDWELAALDLRLFGVYPSIWLERFLWPPLTEVLQLCYLTYYILPIALGAVLWRKGWFDKFFFFVFTLALGFYLSYIGYILVPAIGPRFILAGQQTRPLVGVFLFEPIRAMLDRAEGITRDCFPSGHTQVTLTVLYYARRFHRRTFWWLLGPGSGLIISTVYLRYHYVVDLLAGALLAAFVVAVAEPLYRALGGKLRPEGRGQKAAGSRQ